MPTRYRRLLLVAGMASLLDSAAIVTVGSALPVWRAAFVLNAWTVGLLSSAMTASIAAGAFVGGRIADRIGSTRVFAAAIALYVAGATVLVAAPSTAALLVGVTVLGLASGADLPASLALLAENAPAAVRGHLVALTQVMWTLGIVAATLTALLVAPFALAGTRVAFAALAIAAVCTYLARRTMIVDASLLGLRGREQRGPDGVGQARGAQPSSLVLIAVFYVLYTLVANTFGAFRTYFLVVVGGAGQTLATAISFALTLLGLVGTVVFSVLVDTRWRRRIFPFGAALLCASQVVIAVTAAESFTVVVLALVAYTLAYPYVGEGLYKVWAQEWASPQLRSTFQGTTIAIARIAAAAFALVTPTLMARNPGALFWLLSGCALGSGIVGSVVVRRRTGVA